MPAMPDCLFCKIAAHEVPSDIVFEDDDIIAFNDIAPQAPVHILIIPKVHIASANELDAGHAHVMGQLALRARALATQRRIAAPGYRLIVNCNAEGGQTVYHLHMHLMGGRQLGALG